jgi:hypothetical protein
MCSKGQLKASLPATLAWLLPERPVPIGAFMFPNAQLDGLLFWAIFCGSWVPACNALGKVFWFDWTEVLPGNMNTLSPGEKETDKECTGSTAGNQPQRGNFIWSKLVKITQN